MILRPAAALAAALLCSTALGASAQSFNRIAAFPVDRNLPERADRLTETSAEIVTATGDGMILAYSDSPRGVVGLIDIADPANPQPRGAVEVGGEPTAVAALGNTIFAGVNTSESFVAPSGHLEIIDALTGAATKSCDLGGQPDSIALAPDGSFLVVAVENERDEDLNDGAIPQAPAGFVAIIPLRDGAPDCAAMVRADVTGLAAVAPEDPEPEFVDVSAAGEIAVTLQENNHVVILDRTGAVLSHFSAGAVDLENVDLARDGALRFAQSQPGRLREPDAVQWIDADRLMLVNEGDYEGGSRGFTIVSRTGEVLWESGAAFEHEVARHGHYPEHRSRSKGVEPEGGEVATFGETRYLFVLSERGSMVGVYRDTGAAPEFVQLLPSGVSPEGAVAIPSRNLLVTANEVDLGEDGAARSHVMIYALGEGAPAYPTIVSQNDAEGRPIGWGALSGLTADPETPGRLFAVSDSVYGMAPAIYAIDATRSPAVITAKTVVTRGGQPAQKLDLEGIAADGQGGFWLASEGRSDRLIPHALFRVDAKGEIREEVPFPAELAAHEIRFGAEGIAKVGDVLWVAMQREWGDDPAGFVKLLAYDAKEKTWGAVRYPLEPKGAGWMGLSEIAVHGGHAYIVERDNLIGEQAAVKRLYRVALPELRPAALGGELPVVAKELVRDFIPDLKRWNGYVQDKVEGFAVDADGTGWVVTDNDGVDDASGETLFWSIGPMPAQFGGLPVESGDAPLYIYRSELSADQHFAFGSAALQPADRARIDRIVERLRGAAVPQALVKGHTDRLGPLAVNLDLSLARAEAVRAHAAHTVRFAPGQVAIAGLADAAPVAACPDLTGDALIACLAPNRRVSVTFASRERIAEDGFELVAEIGPGQSVDLLAVEGVTAANALLRR